MLTLNYLETSTVSEIAHYFKRFLGSCDTHLKIGYRYVSTFRPPFLFPPDRCVINPTSKFFSSSRPYICLKSKNFGNLYSKGSKLEKNSVQNLICCDKKLVHHSTATICSKIQLSEIKKKKKERKAVVHPWSPSILVQAAHSNQNESWVPPRLRTPLHKLVTSRSSTFHSGIMQQSKF